MATDTWTITLKCPAWRDDEAAHECGADIDVVLEWEGGDSRYGADRDGNRWVDVPGQWVFSHTTTCKAGHTLDASEEGDLAEEAERFANKEWGR